MGGGGTPIVGKLDPFFGGTKLLVGTNWQLPFFRELETFWELDTSKGKHRVQLHYNGLSGEVRSASGHGEIQRRTSENEVCVA